MIKVGTVVFFDCRVVVAETRLLVDMNYHLWAPLLYKLNLKLTDIPDFSLMQWKQRKIGDPKNVQFFKY